MWAGRMTSDRVYAQSASVLVEPYVHADLVSVSDVFSREHVNGSALGDDLAGSHEQ
jgi:hypothetical protein